MVSIANDPATSDLKIGTTDANGNTRETTIGEYLQQTIDGHNSIPVSPADRVTAQRDNARDKWNKDAVDGLIRHGKYDMAHGYVRDIKDLEMRRIAKERLDAAQEAGVEARSVSERIEAATRASETAKYKWEKRRARKAYLEAVGGYRDFLNTHGLNRRSFEIAYSNQIAKAQGYELNPTNQAMYAAQQKAWGSGQAYTLPSSQGFRDTEGNFQLQSAGGDPRCTRKGLPSLRCLPQLVAGPCRQTPLTSWGWEVT